MKQTRLLLALVVMIIPHKADAWSSMASQTYQKVKSAALAVEEYRQDTGKLPDPRKGWISIRNYPQARFAEQADMFPDSWKRELVYGFAKPSSISNSYFRMKSIQESSRAVPEPHRT